jgi:hypothetical protein
MATPGHTPKSPAAKFQAMVPELRRAKPVYYVPGESMLGLIDRNFPCQTLKIRKVSLVVMGS